jgi:hypothetical protein
MRVSESCYQRIVEESGEDAGDAGNAESHWYTAGVNVRASMRGMPQRSMAQRGEAGAPTGDDGSFPVLIGAGNLRSSWREGATAGWSRTVIRS